jgi:hypothetical protein
LTKGCVVDAENVEEKRAEPLAAEQAHPAARQTWEATQAAKRAKKNRGTLIAIAVGVAVGILLLGGCGGFIAYVFYDDAQLKKDVTSTMRELPMGSTPADMRRRLGDPWYVVRRRVHGQSAFCMQYSITYLGEEDLRTACYVRGRRVS